MELLRYFYHPDHLGSSSWITDNTGRPIQHLHYLPFGEDWVDQRNSSWNAPYTFSGKEKDAETGYGYFGARYYDSGLSIWLSVDPMSDKYPSMSPYNYCGNNPVILVDPDGREVEYNSFIDRIIVGIKKTTDIHFEKSFNELEASSETYVFNFNTKGNSKLSTNGKKLFINYSITSDLRKNGDNIFSVLKHETEHGMQFQHGEIGFAVSLDIGKDGKMFTEWKPVNYDINDELNATTIGFENGFVMNAQSVRGQWGNEGSEVETRQQQINWLRDIKDYRNLSGDFNVNTNREKIQTSTRYQMPYTLRNF